MGRIRLIEFDPSYARMVNRAFDKVRQAASGMPAVIIRMLDALTAIMEQTGSAEQRRILLRQGEMIMLSATESVPDPNDLEDIRRRSVRLHALAVALDGSTDASTDGGPPSVVRPVE